MSDAQADVICAAGKRLSAEGLTSYSWGNISLRGLHDGHRSFFITASGRECRFLQPKDILSVSLDDFSPIGCYPPDVKPSLETRLHGYIYRRRDSAAAIVHTHQLNASVAACMPQGLGLPMAKYAAPGTEALAAEADAALGEDGIVLLANHGIVCVGESMQAAVDAAINAENFCLQKLNELAPQLAPLRNDVCRVIGVGGRENVFAECGFPFADVLRTIYEVRKDADYLLFAASRCIGQVAENFAFAPSMLDDAAQLAGAGFRSYVLRAEGNFSRGSLNELAAAEVEGDGILVAPYGALCIGASKAQAAAAAGILHKNCRCLLETAAAGCINPLPEEEAAALRRFYKDVYLHRALGGQQPF